MASFRVRWMPARSEEGGNESLISDWVGVRERWTSKQNVSHQCKLNVHWTVTNCDLWCMTRSPLDSPRRKHSLWQLFVGSSLLHQICVKLENFRVLLLFFSVFFAIFPSIHFWTKWANFFYLFPLLSVTKRVPENAPRYTTKRRMLWDDFQAG